MPTMDFAEAATWFENAADEMDSGWHEAEARTIEDALIIAEDQSSGTLSTAELRRRGHPYARRHGKPLEDPRKINAQSKTFRAMWDTEGPADGADGPESAIFNRDPKAERLEKGTRRMFPRAVDEAIEERLAPRREARLDRVLDSVIS